MPWEEREALDAQPADVGEQCEAEADEPVARHAREREVGERAAAVGDVRPAGETTNWSAQTMDEHLAEIHGIFAEALEPHQQPASENTVPVRKRSMG